MTPSYTSTVDLPSVYQGDSQEPFNLKIRYKNESALIQPTHVSCTVSDMDGQYVASLPYQNMSGTVSISGLTPSQTLQLAPGFYRYYITYHLADGSEKTYVSGQFEVIQKQPAPTLPH